MLVVWLWVVACAGGCCVGLDCSWFCVSLVWWLVIGCGDCKLVVIASVCAVWFGVVNSVVLFLLLLRYVGFALMIWLLCYLVMICFLSVFV